MKVDFICRLLAITLILPAAALAPARAWEGASRPRPEPFRQFSREEFMLMNLNRGETSAGAQLAEALKSTKEMIKNLDRAARQLERADREFGKSKGRPDDKYLDAAAERIKQALKTAQQLEVELAQSREELKDSIHQALVLSQTP